MAYNKEKSHARNTERFRCGKNAALNSTRLTIDGAIAHQPAGRQSHLHQSHATGQLRWHCGALSGLWRHRNRHTCIRKYIFPRGFPGKYLVPAMLPLFSGRSASPLHSAGTPRSLSLASQISASCEAAPAKRDTIQFIALFIHLQRSQTSPDTASNFGRRFPSPLIAGPGNHNFV